MMHAYIADEMDFDEFYVVFYYKRKSRNTYSRYMPNQVINTTSFNCNFKRIFIAKFDNVFYKTMRC